MIYLKDYMSLAIPQYVSYIFSMYNVNHFTMAPFVYKEKNVQTPFIYYSHKNPYQAYNNNSR